MLLKWVFLKISKYPQEKTCGGVSFLLKLRAFNLYLVEKETTMKVFSREFYKTLKNFFFTEHLRTTASGVATFEKTFRWLLPLLLSSSPPS